jgi:hypothetical protein
MKSAATGPCVFLVCVKKCLVGYTTLTLHHRSCRAGGLMHIGAFSYHGVYTYMTHK